MTSMVLAPSLINMSTSGSLLQRWSLLEIWIWSFHKSEEVVYRLYLHRKTLLLTFCISENWRWLINLGLPFLGLEIIPGKAYLPIEIIDAVYKVTSKIPTLLSIPVGTSILLLEIRFCANQNGNSLTLVDCIPDSDCGDGTMRVYLPQPKQQPTGWLHPLFGLWGRDLEGLPSSTLGLFVLTWALIK